MNDVLTRRRRIADDLRRSVRTELVESWYPAVVDERFGGFYSNLDRRFRPIEPQEKYLVTQARHVWTTSQVSQRLPDVEGAAAWAAHGADYLLDVMWVPERAAFHSWTYAGRPDGRWPSQTTLLARSRALIPSTPVTRALSVATGRRRRRRRRAVRSTYDQAFGIFGLSAYAAATGDERALRCALEAVRSLDATAHDHEHGGYVDAVDAAGEPIDGEACKSADTTIHVLEAFTELERVHPDPLIRDRLVELVDIVCSHMVSDAGGGWVSFRRDWSPVAAADRAGERDGAHIVSFGHDIELAALVVAAADVAGVATPALLATAKGLADHALDHGWDEHHGGLYELGRRTAEGCAVVDRSKDSWVQAEALATLTWLATSWPHDQRDYLDLVERQWDYCRRYLIDHEFGGWFWQGLDALPLERQPGKANPVRATYHVGRAMLDGADRLAADQT